MNIKEVKTLGLKRLRIKDDLKRLQEDKDDLLSRRQLISTFSNPIVIQFENQELDSALRKNKTQIEAKEQELQELESSVFPAFVNLPSEIQCSTSDEARSISTLYSATGYSKVMVVPKECRDHQLIVEDAERHKMPYEVRRNVVTPFMERYSAERRNNRLMGVLQRPQDGDAKAPVNKFDHHLSKQD